MQALQTPQCQPTHTDTFDQNYCHSPLWVPGAKNTSKNDMLGKLILKEKTCRFKQPKVLKFALQYNHNMIPTFIKFLKTWMESKLEMNITCTGIRFQWLL